MLLASANPPPYFNPRTPCGVRRDPHDAGRKGGLQFQSTHPVRGATFSSHPPSSPALFQSTHPVRGATPWTASAIVKLSKFQSTHPVRGATRQIRQSRPFRTYFNPRTPCGVRLRSYRPDGRITNFNPRTPCGVRRTGRRGTDDFNPRTPCGVRHVTQSWWAACPYFNPRTPCGVRRWYPDNNKCSDNISIHAPRAGCDPSMTSS